MRYIYCCVPAKRGLRRTALAMDSDQTRTRDPYLSVFCATGSKFLVGNVSKFLEPSLRQGEPGMPQYIQWRRPIHDSMVSHSIHNLKYLLHHRSPCIRHPMYSMESQSWKRQKMKRLFTLQSSDLAYPYTCHIKIISIRSITFLFI